MNKLLIIDGHNLLFQMFFGMPSRIPGNDGSDIRGVVGFIGAVNRLLDMIEPDMLLVMFDGERENPRKALSEDYKANRPDYSALPDDENPFTQLPKIYTALDYMGVPHTETTDCETDDVIAAYALNLGKENEVYISSFDSDYFQLINKNVKVIRYRGASSVICDEAYVKDKYGVDAALYLDFKCLVGDTSDNVTGVRGIGPKTAAKIVNQLGNLEQIKCRYEELSKEKLVNAIAESTELLDRNYALIKLDGSAAMPFTPDELRFKNPRLRTMDVIYGI